MFVDPGDAHVTGELTTYGTSGVLPLRMTLDQLHRNLLLSATGLTWSAYAGAHVSELCTALGWATPELDTSGDNHGGGRHTAPDPGPGSGRPERGPVPDRHGADSPSAVDEVLRIARTAGIDAAELEITPLSGGGGAWSVAEIDRSWPTQVDSVAVDATRNRVTDEVRFADYPLGAKLARWGIDAHMGSLLGWPNRVALAALGLGLAAMTVLGYRLWWQRGARGTFGPPVPCGQWRRLPAWTLVAGSVTAAGIGWFAPLFGVPPAAFLLVDASVGWCRRRRASMPSRRAPLGRRASG